ncbi:hypothetical protein MANES_02G207050v8 [Manihot esculenta]|uniref:Uncharacterized protein n=1 Tax=Manihot esculenta TaxID=3983 RepID=A0ACB7IA83_MANES|nr:hypothetical protein MANES_02G207050v8 [Manihot esculenta]
MVSGDPFCLKLSDHPCMIVVSTSLIGSRNFRSWNRSMRIALRAMHKLGFIDGTIPMPNKDNEFFEQWKRCDYMVTSWILNSILKDLVDSFIYTVSSRDLQISLISQENFPVLVYFIHLKRLWDELGSIEVLPPCSCGASKAIDDMNNRNRLMQFLMELNEIFDPVRDQILVLNPLPSMNRAYSMALKHESQKEILIKRKLESIENLKGKQKKYDLKKGHCSHCNMDGHVRDTYFKLIGYPNWFKNKTKIEEKPTR